MSKSAQSILDVIQPGDKVTITNPFEQERGGRAVMRGPHGWVLNMAGAQGTPAVATDHNIARVALQGKGTN
jgi:hypothetical protein